MNVYKMQRDKSVNQENIFFEEVIACATKNPINKL